MPPWLLVELEGVFLGRHSPFCGNSQGHYDCFCHRFGKEDEELEQNADWCWPAGSSCPGWDSSKDLPELVQSGFWEKRWSCLWVRMAEYVSWFLE